MGGMMRGMMGMPRGMPIMMGSPGGRRAPYLPTQRNRFLRLGNTSLGEDAKDIVTPPCIFS